jgi:type IV secretory pathway VirB2 component (pilin)
MTLTFSKLKLYLFLIIALFGVTINTSFAGEASKIEDVMCKGYSIFNGPLGKTFAVFAIVALGVGFFLGKVSWGTAIAIALGIGAIFGAPALVATITGGATTCNSSGFGDKEPNKQ